jgi:hypothetical protein
MRFALCRFVLDDPREVSISLEQFTTAADAHERMQLIVASEEKFDAIARNYLDFESDMLNSALETALVGFGQGMEQMGVRRLLNRKLSNLLSATRSYVDFMRHSAKLVLPSEADAMSVIGLFSEHYDKSLSYRTLEVLRNHTQHAGFPIQSVQYSTTAMREVSGTPLKRTVAPILDTEELEQNKKLKRSVVIEITQHGKKVSLKRFVREYVASMASIHERFRELASPIFSTDASIIQELAQAFSSSTAMAKPMPLYAASFEGTKCIQRIFLDDGLHKYGEFLAAGNAHFTHASISFVSGELEKDA